MPSDKTLRETNIPFHSYNAKERPNVMLSSYHGLKFFATTSTIILSTYLVVLHLIMRPSVQRRLVYGHKRFRLPFFSQDPNSILNTPESRGFLRNQVTSHLIHSSDGVMLYSWLIVPPGAYTKHEATLTKSWSAHEAREITLQMIRSDPKAVIALYLHGSGNNLATEWRCEAYRNLSSVSPDHLYVLAFDYRGFGKSSGSPTEDGLVSDAMAMLAWIGKKLAVPRARVLLVGHSLGASVAAAAMHRTAEQNRYAEYAGLMLCSSFTNLSAVAADSKLAGIVPVLKPLTWFKRGRRWIDGDLFIDRWRTEQRLTELVKKTENVRLTILHAEDDDRTPCTMGESIYRSCKSQLEDNGVLTENPEEPSKLCNAQDVKASGKLIRKVILKKGGHQEYMRWHVVSFEAARILTMTGTIG